MPYLANKPFSLAMINGAESVRGINPSLAVVTSGASAAAIVGVVAVEPSPSAFLLQALVRTLAAAVIPDASINFLLEN